MPFALRPNYLADLCTARLKLTAPAGVKALLVHALSEDAKTFYVQNGFLESPLDSMTLVISLQDAPHNMRAQSIVTPKTDVSAHTVQ